MIPQYISMHLFGFFTQGENNQWYRDFKARFDQRYLLSTLVCLSYQIQRKNVTPYERSVDGKNIIIQGRVS